MTTFIIIVIVVVVGLFVWKSKDLPSRPRSEWGQNRKDSWNEAIEANLQPWQDDYGNWYIPTREWQDSITAYWEWKKQNPCGTTLYQDKGYAIPSGRVVSGTGRYTGRTR